MVWYEITRIRAERKRKKVGKCQNESEQKEGGMETVTTIHEGRLDAERQQEEEGGTVALEAFRRRLEGVPE